MKTKALFIDRDGIFNEVVTKAGVIKEYPGLELLTEIKGLGFKLVMVTNQPDIERKLVSEVFVNEVNDRYRKKYSLDGVYVCPFSSNEHPEKKPNPGMFLRAAEDLQIDLSQSYHLGDTERDTLAASRCGCKSILWERDYNKNVEADYRVKSLREVITILERPKETAS